MTIKINFDLYIDFVEMPLHLMTHEEASILGFGGADNDDDDSSIASSYSDDSSMCNNYYDNMGGDEHDYIGMSSTDRDLFDFLDRLDGRPRQRLRDDETDSINLANTRGLRRLPRRSRLLMDSEADDDFFSMEDALGESYPVMALSSKDDHAAVDFNILICRTDEACPSQGVELEGTVGVATSTYIKDEVVTRRRSSVRRSTGFVSEDTMKELMDLVDQS
jgi:hypothetical protein